MRITIKQGRIALFVCFCLLISGIFLVPYGAAFAKNSSAGVLLADDQGRILFEQNGDKKYIPASILKILTSLAAIQTLGQDFRFKTEFAFDEASKNLYIKGFGDPLFISEVIDAFCDEIRLKSKSPVIKNIILDQTYFHQRLEIPGRGDSLNPYDASSGALCANFNTIMFKHHPMQNRFISAEPQTPLLDYFQDDIKNTGLSKGRIILSTEDSLIYPGLLIRHFLEQKGLTVTGRVLLGDFEAADDRAIFLSPFTLKDVIRKLLKFSNNFIANQMLLTLGAAKQKPPATLGKGVIVLNRFASQDLNLEGVVLSEGSGLSRQNRISPRQMLKVLMAFKPYHDLLNHTQNDFFKTGTLSDVRTRAGYIEGKDGRLFPYVILVNEKNRNYDAVLARLHQMVTE